MGIYEKNLAALDKGQPQVRLSDYIEKKEWEDAYSFRIEQAVNGQNYLLADTPQGIWQLNSRYDPEKAAKEYAKRYENIRPYESFVVFGLSDGRALRHMIFQGDETNLWIVYEPSGALFETVLREIDLTDIFLNERVHMVVSSGDELKNILKCCISYNNRFLLQHCILPGYDVLFCESCERSIDEMVMQMEYSQIMKNTVQRFHQEFALCSIQSMADALYQSNIYQMRKCFQEHNVCDVPAIIVAAGPSLSKNVEDLRLAKGKAFIMVVDAALRAMERYGICPDLALSVDARVRYEFFLNVDIQKIPFFFSSTSKPGLIQTHKGRHFYDLAPNDLFAFLARKVSDNEYVSLGSGGSVSTVAFSLALYLGFHNIIFVGQDLAFTDGQSYHQDLVKDAKSNQKYINSRACVWAKDYQGNYIQTDYQMDMYRRWLEKEIAVLPQKYHVIDATEGGAKIQGATILSLKDAIDTLCGRSVDFSQLLQEVPLAYNEQQRNYIMENIQKEPERLRELSEVVEEGIGYTEELNQACYKNDIVEQQKLLKQIQRINEKILSEPVQDLLLYYNSQMEYHVAEDIFTKDFTVSQLCEKFMQWYEACKPALLAIADDIEQAL